MESSFAGTPMVVTWPLTSSRLGVLVPSTRNCTSSDGELAMRVATKIWIASPAGTIQPPGGKANVKLTTYWVSGTRTVGADAVAYTGYTLWLPNQNTMPRASPGLLRFTNALAV